MEPRAVTPPTDQKTEPKKTTENSPSPEAKQDPQRIQKITMGYLKHWLTYHKISDDTDLSTLDAKGKEKATQIIQFMHEANNASSLEARRNLMSTLFTSIVKEAIAIKGESGLRTWAISLFRERDYFYKTIRAAFNFLARELAQDETIKNHFEQGLKDYHQLLDQIRKKMIEPLMQNETWEKRKKDIKELEKTAIDSLYKLIQLGCVEAYAELKTYKWSDESNNHILELLPDIFEVSVHPYLPSYLVLGYEKQFFELIHKDDKANAREFDEKDNIHFETHCCTAIRPPIIPKPRGLVISKSNTSQANTAGAASTAVGANAGGNHTQPAALSGTAPAVATVASNTIAPPADSKDKQLQSIHAAVNAGTPGQSQLTTAVAGLNLDKSGKGEPVTHPNPDSPSKRSGTNSDQKDNAPVVTTTVVTIAPAQPQVQTEDGAEKKSNIAAAKKLAPVRGNAKRSPAKSGAGSSPTMFPGPGGSKVAAKKILGTQEEERIELPVDSSVPTRNKFSTLA